MQKSLYDQSTLTWSPQGRLYQVEYAMEAVNQGNLLIGVKSNTHVVLVGFKTAPNEKLSYFPEKLFKVSNHIGIGIAGLTPDGRLLYQYMKNQCLNYNYTFNADYPIEKLVNKIAEKSQLKTQRGENKRPYGVGLLIAGFDRTGPRLFRTCPSANFYEYNCVAIGSRCQGATSFLENNMEKLGNMSKDELIKIALEATKKAEDVKIDGNNLDVIIVGKDETTKLLSVEEIDNYLKGVADKMDLSSPCESIFLSPKSNNQNRRRLTNIKFKPNKNKLFNKIFKKYKNTDNLQTENNKKAEINFLNEFNNKKINNNNKLFKDDISNTHFSTISFSSTGIMLKR